MNAIFDQVDLIRRLEREGLGRGATKGDPEKPAAISEFLIRFGVMPGAALALAVAAIGAIVSAR